MGFEFSKGPKSTGKSVAQVAEVVKEVGQEKRFMGLLRRLGTPAATTMGNGQYGPFAPSADDDPFMAASDRQPDFRVGWHWGNTVTNSMGMTLQQGWVVIFDVYDDGGKRSVVAKVKGKSQRGEVKKFVDQVFDLL